MVKAVILAGGYGTRISEETMAIPKPMVAIGDKPIIWHIMKLYSYYGINDFIICVGYKGYAFKEYFANYYRHESESITFDLKNNNVEIHKNSCEPWNVTLVETGLETMTGGRIKAIENFVKYDDFFCLTYGDGVADVNIEKLINFHKNHGKLATLTSVVPPGRFGALEIDNNNITAFTEKPAGDGSYINGGFFVLNPKVIDYISDKNTVFEQEPLNRLAKEGQLTSFKHDGFWQCMDTLRDKNYLENLWNSKKSPWKLW